MYYATAFLRHRQNGSVQPVRSRRQQELGSGTSATSSIAKSLPAPPLVFESVMDMETTELTPELKVPVN